MSGTLAITGGTGFVGRTLVAQAVAAGWQVRALTRKPQPTQPGVTWVVGTLGDTEALKLLVTDVAAVVNLAGVLTARTRDGYRAANVDGVDALLIAAQHAHIGRFIHVSSLAAREPGLSDYGWSKAQGDALVQASTRNWTIVRPPAVFGPGDTGFLEVFRMARRGFIALPPEGALSVIEVGDLARLLLALITYEDSFGMIYEPDDGRDDWTQNGFAQAIAAAVGTRARIVHLPKTMLMVGAKLDQMMRGDKAMLTADRVRYFCHPDWRVTAAHRPPAQLCYPQTNTGEALRATAARYRAAGWLK